MFKKKFHKLSRCCLCNSTPKNWVKLFSLNKHQNLMRCRICDLTFNDNCRVDFENIYGTDYFEPKKNKKETGGYFDYQNSEEKIKKEYGFAIDFIKKIIKKSRQAKILDVGAGYGFFLNNFKSKNAHLYALEISQVCTNYIRKNFTKIKIYQDDFLKHNFNIKFDVICMFEFIEHVIDPDSVFQKAQKLLKKGGYLIISTPNIGNFSFGIMKKNWPALHPKSHNVYFEKKTLINFLNKYSLKIKFYEEKNILYFSFLHIRMRLTSLFPKLSALFRMLKPLDNYLFPVFSGGSINLIAQK